jgi:chromosome segregation ATPase
MLLSIMDGAELDLTNTMLSSSSKTTSSTAPNVTTTLSSISTSDDYEKDLQLAAELGRCLLERNQELQTYIGVLQKQIDDEQCDIKLLHAKLESTREQLETKCKQTEVLDATNFDLERELAQQRRDNERDRQRIKELSDLCEKTRKQCFDLEHEYETFRLKQFATHFFPKSFNSPVQKPIISMPKLRRSHSFNSNLAFHSSSDSSTSSNIFDISSASIFKAHLTELKSRIHSLTSECSILNETLHQSEQEKVYLIDRITHLERQRRDDNDSLQHELNHYKKLLEKHTNDHSRDLLSNIYSPPEHDLSLYDEVLFENKQSTPRSSYEPTNYKDLFARVYDKLKVKTNNKTST